MEIQMKFLEIGVNIKGYKSAVPLALEQQDLSDLTPHLRAGLSICRAVGTTGWSPISRVAGKSRRDEISIAPIPQVRDWGLKLNTVRPKCRRYDTSTKF